MKQVISEDTNTKPSNNNTTIFKSNNGVTSSNKTLTNNNSNTSSVSDLKTRLRERLLKENSGLDNSKKSKFGNASAVNNKVNLNENKNMFTDDFSELRARFMKLSDIKQ